MWFLSTERPVPKTHTFTSKRIVVVVVCNDSKLEPDWFPTVTGSNIHDA